MRQSVFARPRDKRRRRNSRGNRQRRLARRPANAFEDPHRLLKHLQRKRQHDPRAQQADEQDQHQLRRGQLRQRRAGQVPGKPKPEKKK